MTQDLDLTDFHWLMDMLQTIEVGVVVLDRDYRIKAWNGFMENHSGKCAEDVRGQILFEVFAEISEKWFKRKTQPLFVLKNRVFSHWEQRPYLFAFKNYRPITGSESFMYQNVTISALVTTTGEVQNLCLLVYDVTELASTKKLLRAACARLNENSREDTPEYPSEYPQTVD